MARRLLEDQLAACVNIEEHGTSFYRWEGEKVEETEWRLLAKTRKERVEETMALIEEHHPYDCPEILVQNVGRASDDYERWVQSQIR